MSFERLGDITRRITNRLEPVVYSVPIDGAVAARLNAYASEQGTKAETIIAEALRSYLGGAA